MNVRLARSTLIAAVVVALSIAAAINAYWFPLAFPDEADYWTLAQNLVRTGTLSFDGSTPSAYRPPLVAWILAPIVASGASMAAARPLFVLFFALTGVLTGSFLCRIFPASKSIPPLGTALVLSHPLYFFSAGNLYPQQVLTPLLVAAFVLASRKPLSTQGAIRRSAAIGLSAGVSLLASSAAVFALVPVLSLLAWEDLAALRGRKVLEAYRSAIAGIVVLFCVVPLAVRNSHNVHPGFYLSLNAGINLICGNSPATTPVSGTNVDISEVMGGHEADSEYELNRHLSATAVANIRGNPGYYARLSVRKFFAGLGNTVETVTHGYNKPATFAMWGYTTLGWIGVAMLCVCYFRPRRQLAGALATNPAELWTFALLSLAAYLFTIAGYSVFFTRLRFRIPVDIALAVASAAGWLMIVSRFLAPSGAMLSSWRTSADEERRIAPRS